MDASGNLSGATYLGGVKGTDVACVSDGCGSIYELDTAGKLHLLFGSTGGADGAYPYGRWKAHRFR
jgi:hypothetical protein